jgi:hypothetical protein
VIINDIDRRGAEEIMRLITPSKGTAALDAGKRHKSIRALKKA